MFDKNFDPLGDLKRISQNQEIINKTFKEIALAVNEHSEAIIQMAKTINEMDLAIRGLHGRIQLLEVVRQHENSKD
jgi:methyl-accepting chemotaxis protein